MRRPIAIDFFSGCGGLTLGLKQAGFDVRAAVDIDSLAVRTYRMNHAKTVAIERDILSLSSEELLKRAKLKRGQIDLVAGCPPCQGFSTLRTLNGGKRVHEPLNDLVFEFARMIEELKPRAVMLENVPGLRDDARFDELTLRLERLGFNWKAACFDAADFGVPQRRKRMILIAARGFCPEFGARAKRRKYVRTVLRSLNTPGESGDPLHDYGVNRAPHVQALISRIPVDGGSRSSLSSDEQLRCHQQCAGFYDIYGRMAWDAPSPTITGGCINPSKGRFLHPEQDRAITLREAALLQGFPRTYRFALDRGRYPAAQMIGNAFPPGLAKTHAEELLRGLSAQSSVKMRSR